MPTKKSIAKPVAKKQTIIKIAETIGIVAGEISLKKDQVAEMASNAIDTVKKKFKVIASSKPEKNKPALKQIKQNSSNRSVAKKSSPATVNAEKKTLVVSNKAVQKGKDSVNKPVKKKTEKKIKQKKTEPVKKATAQKKPADKIAKATVKKK